MIYAFGNVEGSVANQFFNVLNNVLIVAMHVNPLLIGLILGVKTLWDSVTDPIMAHITDQWHGRWGRRRPFILVGGVSRIAFLLAIVAFMPTGGHLTTNPVMEAQKFANEGVKEATDALKTAVQSYEQLPIAEPEVKGKILERLPAVLESTELAYAKMVDNLSTLEADAIDRLREFEQEEANLLEITEANFGSPELERLLREPQGMVTSSKNKFERAEELIDKTVESRRKAIAAEYVTRHLLHIYEVKSNATVATVELTREAAAAAYAELDLEPLEDIFAMPPRPTPKPKESRPPWAPIIDGFTAYFAPENTDQRPLILYVLITTLIFTTLTTVQSVPYYALGIELSPSYNGRTQVVTYRAIMDKIAGLIQPWVPVFCFSLLFVTALDGLFWVALLACVIGIPSTILMCMYTRERTKISMEQRKKKANLFKSMWAVANNKEFLKIFALYCFIGLTNGMFQQLGFFLNVYWVMGSALSGATLGAWIAMVAWGLGLITLPLINWGCRKYQKHKVLGFAIIWMAIGTAIKWWAMNPEHPEFQFILPFFFSVGIGSVYTVLPTMMADVTDLDELKHGVRREGMFGAVMAFLMKFIGTLTPILAGAVLVISGFDASLEFEQTPETIFTMRLMYSFVPAGMLLLALLIIWNYPLTRERVAEVKTELKRRREAQEAKEAAEAAGEETTEKA